MIEPLKELSLFAYYWAPHFCHSSCRLYHQNWSITRFIQSGQTLPPHADFFIEKIAHYHRQGHKKLLISGAADTGLLAVVQQAMMEHQIPPQDFNITLIDRCSTVIEQNKLYAKILGLSVEFICDDILSTPLTDFDIVLAHHFINFFSGDNKQELFDRWAKCLSKKGVLLIYNKTSDHIGEARSITLNSQKIDKRLSEAKQQIELLELPPEILSSIETFLKEEKIRAQFTKTELMQLIQKSQLCISEHQEFPADAYTSASRSPTSTRLDAEPRTIHLLTLAKVS